MKLDKLVISRRRALRQTSLAIGAAAVAPTIALSSAWGEWGAPPALERASVRLSADTPAQESRGAAVKYAVLRSPAAAGDLQPAIVDGIPFVKNTMLVSSEEGGSAR